MHNTNLSAPKTAAELLALLDEQMSLKQLQTYMQLMVEQRGFTHESARDTLLLLVEEVGELAKAIRKKSGLKVDAQKAEQSDNLQDELADVFIMLLILCNTYDIDLFHALQHKEQKNATRTWKVAQ